MMTPEARARAVVLAWYHGPYNINNFDQTRADVEIAAVAAAIRAAVEDERESCAQVASDTAVACQASYAVDAETEDYLTGAEQSARTIETAIRARKETH